MNSLRGPTTIYAMDSNSGAWPVEIIQGDREKTSFLLQHGLVEFVFMPIRLRNASGTF